MRSSNTSEAPYLPTSGTHEEETSATVCVVYILECADGTYYTGCTRNLAQRVRAHQEGRGARYTRTHGVRRVAYTEACVSWGEALSREAAIKRLRRPQKDALVANGGRLAKRQKKW